MKSRSWIELSLNVPPRYHDIVIASLIPAGFNGFQQEEDQLRCIIEKARWDKRSRQSTHRVFRQLEAKLRTPPFSSQIRVLRETNWNKRWEQSIGIVDATDRIVIAPSWKKLSKRRSNKIVVRIDPKMSFGTGHHETTRLSLSLIQKYLLPGTKVLDYGCGTAILAIAAAKLGAHSVLAVDNDEWAIMNAKENVRLNHVSNIVRIFRADTHHLPRPHFDLIAANIDLVTIQQHLRDFKKWLRPRGVMILSGLLVTDVSRLLPRLIDGRYTPLEVCNENEWIGLALRKNR